MKLTNFGIFFLFTCVYGEIQYGCISDEKRERTLYDVHQFACDAAEGFKLAKTIDRKMEFLVENDVHNKVKLLNAQNLISIFINSAANVSNSTCFADLSYMKEDFDLKNFQTSWSVKMLDSFGKPESSILEGNVKWAGDFDECRSVYAPKKEDSDVGGFHGQYCTLGVTLAKVLPLSIGICVPDTCNAFDIEEYINGSILIPALNRSGIHFEISTLTCKAKSLKLSGGGVVTISIMSVFFALVILGSSITAIKYFTGSKDPCKKPADEENVADDCLEEPLVINEGSPTKLRVFIDMWDPFLNCFCLFTNGSKLLSTGDTQGQLLCLHGIRFLSMTWVILCHVYSTPVGLFRTMKNLEPLIDNLPFQAILNGWYSVDSFFVLSGFLMSYLYFQECAKKKGKTPWLYFYIHRYLRLTPVYMIVLAFYTTILPVIGSGPFWPDTNVDTNCHKRWWWNLIYINNFLNSDKQCMAWSWYLANDMQFFAISPLFLITLWRWPIIGYCILALFLCICWISGFLITYQNNLVAGTLGYFINDITDIKGMEAFTSKWNDYTNKIYYMPYTRIAPYLIGMGLGYILFKRKTTNTKINSVTLWIGWVLAVSVGLYCVYGVYHQTISLTAASFYNAFTRTGYSLSLSWLMFVCSSGQGGVVNKILSYKLFIPLSRLTYCVYLIHLIFVHLYLNSMKTTLVFTHQTMVLLFLGFLIVSYAFAMLVSLVFESPIIRIEKLVRNKFHNK